MNEIGVSTVRPLFCCTSRIFRPSCHCSSAALSGSPSCPQVSASIHSLVARVIVLQLLNVWSGRNNSGLMIQPWD